MPRKYRDKRTERFAAGERVRAFSGIERQANRRLTFLESADSLQAVAAYPSNRFEALKGDRQGQYSIRINDQRPVAHLLRVARRRDRSGQLEIVDYY